jgi:hypothetical protein
MVPPAGPVSRPGLPQPMPQRPPIPRPAAGRAWYQEPAMLGTILVLALVVVVFAILIALASG